MDGHYFARKNRPTTNNCAHAAIKMMIRSIRGYNIFKGFRGRPKSDIKALEKSVASLSDMVMNHPEIAEMDINPLMVHEEGKGATVADYRIVLKDKNSSICKSVIRNRKSN